MLKLFILWHTAFKRLPTTALENNEILQNGLGVIQSIYNFFNSPKRQSILQNMKGDNLEQFLKLKSLSKTRWACHWQAAKAIERHILRIATALVKISESKEAKLCGF